MAASSPASRLVVCDAGPIIHLDELGCLDLLDDFDGVMVPPAVWKEIEQHRPRALGMLSVQIRLAERTKPLPDTVETLCRTLVLHRGEIDALGLALELQSHMFFTDDAAARFAAESLNLPVHGTVGLIVRAIRREQRSSLQVVQLLQSIPMASTLHLKQSFLSRIIEQVKAETR